MIYTAIGKLIVGIAAFLAVYSVALFGMLPFVDKPKQNVVVAAKQSPCESRVYRSLHHQSCVLVLYPYPALENFQEIRSEWRSTAELGINKPTQQQKQSHASKIAGAIRELVMPCSAEHPCGVQP